MFCKILRSFPYSPDGIKTGQASKGETLDLPVDIVHGLEREGYIEVCDTTLSSPENKIMDGAPEIKADEVEIPDGWADLTWPKLAKLAASVSDEKITDKDSALDAINAELAERGLSEPSD